MEGTAKRNFGTNKKRFIADEDFFHVTDSKGLDEIRSSGSSDFKILSDAANEVTLITETGYLMLVKSFTDDLAWQIQRQLVKVYFRAKQEAQAAQPEPKPDGPQPPVHYPLTRPELAKCREKVACVDRYFRFHSSSAIAAAIYAPLFQRFKISRMEQLNAMDLPLALEILQRMQDDAHAYYLEGVRRERSAMTTLYSCAGLPLPHLAAGQMELPA
ncbi:ORF6N domain-containing protein [Methylomagnum ishizawai]|uniref:ORF6N domain-containing protein n=1 Tax=Methylomagnum ishizawai TaxID=1760988 RepID=UPI001C327097|nr:ORF6N domain-containing protein [Methylomagnum ishizawai]BBL75432.1 hypothetical protein MishRS11D_25300 [Methylomagnum ishizawai]